MHECMQINKYHAVALHLTCMGTLHISGVNAQHGLNKRFFSEGCPPCLLESVQMKIYQRVVHSIIGVYPNENIGGLSTVFSECCPQYYRSLSK